MGVARSGWPTWATALCLLALVAAGVPSTRAAAAAAAQCKRRVETSSSMFGAPWADTFVLYTHDYHWRASGDIRQLSLLFGEAEGCVKGVKAQYGADPANAQRLGLETQSLSSRSLQLREGERIVQAEYKVNGRCIEYLSFRTNHGRQLAIGRADSATPTSIAAPATPGNYLGYLNGHTAKAMSNPHVGRLMQLQLVWVSASCQGDEEVMAALAGSSSGSSSSWSGSETSSSSSSSSSSLIKVEARVATASTSSSSSSKATVSSGKCSSNQLCSEGRCATSSCSLNGLGADVPNLVCPSGSGSNMQQPLKYTASATWGVAAGPCSFLQCKLDTEQCITATVGGVMGVGGVGGFCTGRVVATGSVEQLHPQGKQWLGYPCIEHSLQQQQQGGAASDLVAKAWKVCDCVRAKAPLRTSLAVLLPNGTITSFTIGGSNSSSSSSNSSSKSSSSSSSSAHKDSKQQGIISVPLMPVYDMGLQDVVTQWLAAKAGNAALPSVTIPTALATHLQELLPGFSTPSIIIANTAAPLMARPEWLTGGPSAKAQKVFVVPNAALTPLRAFLPDLTALPTLALPPNMTSAAEAAEAAFKLSSQAQQAQLRVAELTDSKALTALVTKLGLPTFLQLVAEASTTHTEPNAEVGPHLVPLEHMHFGNAVVQWAMAMSSKAPLPKLVLSDRQQLYKLQALVPGLVTPCVVVHNISHPLLHKPDNLSMPLFELPDKATAEVAALLPELTSLPTFLVLKEQEQLDMPKLHLTDFIAPNMRPLADALGPAIPQLLKHASNITIPALDISGGSGPMLDMLSHMSGPWGNVLAMLPQLAPNLAGGLSGVDLSAVPSAVAAVQQALATTGARLQYLRVTEDLVQEWGVKKVEGYLTNALARSVSPRDADSTTTLVVDSGDAETASQKQAQVAADLLAVVMGQQPQPLPQPAAIGPEQPVALAASTAAVATAAVARGTPAPAASGPQPEPHHSSSSSPSSSSDEPPARPAYKASELPKALAAATAAVAAAAADAIKGSPVPVQAAEPVRGMLVPMAPAAALTAKAAHADYHAGVRVVAGPKPATQPHSQTQQPAAAAADSSSAAGVPVPLPAAPEAPAAAGAAAPLPQQPPAKPQAATPKRAQPPPPAAAAAAEEDPQSRVGYVDDDGAVVVNVEEARRAFMSEDQWAKVTPEQREKLLLLLNV